MPNIFSKHLHDVGETYFQHMKVALSFSVRLFAGSIASLLHAIFPFCCKDTASNLMAKVVVTFKQHKRGEIFNNKVLNFEREMNVAAQDDDCHFTAQTLKDE